MKKNRLVIGCLMTVISCLIVSCANKGGQGEEGHTHHEEEDKSIVQISEQQAQAIELTTRKISKRNIGRYIVTTGELAVPPQNIAKVSTPISGRISRIKVIEGDVVKKGQVLAILTDPAIIAFQEDYLKLYHEFNYLKQDRERKKLLLEKNAISEKKVQELEGKYRAVEGSLLAKEANLKLIGVNIETLQQNTIVPSISIIAPINGSVTHVDATMGAYHEVNNTLFELLDNDELHADLRVFEKDIYAVKKGQKVRFTVQGMEDKEFSAEIFSVGKKFESDPKAIHLHAEINNKTKDLIAGSYIQGRIEIDSILTNAVSSNAIVNVEGRSYVFMKVKTDNQDHNHEYNHLHENEKDHAHNSAHEHDKLSFKKVEVIIGEKFNNYVAIKFVDMIPNNAIFVQSGAYYLEAEIGKSETEHTH